MFNKKNFRVTPTPLPNPQPYNNGVGLLGEFGRIKRNGNPRAEVQNGGSDGTYMDLYHPMVIVFFQNEGKKLKVQLKEKKSRKRSSHGIRRPLQKRQESFNPPQFTSKRAKMGIGSRWPFVPSEMREMRLRSVCRSHQREQIRSVSAAISRF